MADRQKRGFTLLEISIVIAIIALLIGGVLVGREMVRTSELRSVLTDIDSIAVASRAFEEKYNCFPGDCRNASEILTGTTNGDGDGKISSTWYADKTAYPLGGGTNVREAFEFYIQLSKASLIRGQYVDLYSSYPSPLRPYVPGRSVLATKFNNAIGYSVGYAHASPAVPANDYIPALPNYKSNVIFVGSQQNGYAAIPGGGRICCETYAIAFSPSDALYLDTKMDDGLPGYGSVINFDPGEFLGCVDQRDQSTSPAKYLLTEKGRKCGLTISGRL